MTILRTPPDDPRSAPRPPGTRLVADGEALEHLIGLVGGPRSDAPAVWVTFLDDHDRVLPCVLPVEGLPEHPDPGTVEALVTVVREVVRAELPGARSLVAVVRPAGGDYGTVERRWATALWREADATGWRLRLVAAVGDHRARVLDRARCTPTLG